MCNSRFFEMRQRYPNIIKLLLHPQDSYRWKFSITDQVQYQDILISIHHSIKSIWQTYQLYMKIPPSFQIHPILCLVELKHQELKTWMTSPILSWSVPFAPDTFQEIFQTKKKLEVCHPFLNSCIHIMIICNRKGENYLTEYQEENLGQRKYPPVHGAFLSLWSLSPRRSVQYSWSPRM